MSIFMAALVIVVVSCSKNEVAVNSNTTTSNTIVQGNWKVTYVTDNNTDHTADFNGFTLKFVAGGTASISNSLLSVSGNWNSYNDDSQNKLSLAFNTTILSFIGYLNEDWHILERTTVKIRMEHISGGGGGTDYLTIEKL